MNICDFHVPDALIVLLFSIVAAFVLAPYLGGIELGPLKIPHLTDHVRRIAMYLGPILVATSIVPFTLPCNKCRPEIERPTQGSNVAETERVVATNLCAELRHYVLVTSETSDRFLTGKIDMDGKNTGTGYARFGHGDVGPGKSFNVQVLTTAANLDGGPLTEVPQDGKLSPAIQVLRRK